MRIPYDISGAREKELVICGKSHGFSADYGHVDMVFGRKARDEVFPRIRDWFVRHDAAPSAAAGHGETTRARTTVGR